MKAELKERIEQMRQGEVPEGYRRTKDIGIAPYDWAIGQMSDVLHNEQRPVPKPTEAYLRLRIRSHAKGTFHELVKNPDEVNMDELYEVKTNDLIVNITFAWEHAIALADKADEGLLVSHRFPTYVFNNENCPEFYKAVVTQRFFKNMLGYISPGGAGRNRVMSKPAFLKLPCYIPPTKEQERIAEILTHCDKVIELKKQLIEEKRRQKKWLMQNLLNPDSGVKLLGFEGEWMNATFGELFAVVAGKDLNKEVFSPVQDQVHIFEIYSNSKYNSGVYGYSRIKEYEGNAITITARGDVGKASYRENPFCAIGRLIVMHPECELNCQLISEYINTNVNFFSEKTGVSQLTVPQVEKVNIKLPCDIKHQIAIASVLSTADHEIDLLEQELAQWQIKKKSLMQLLLTGIVRV